MSVSTQQPSLSRPPSTAGLYEVVELILDKGLVIDAYVRVSLVGIELLTIDARVVIASVDTYLRFAEAVNRLDLTQTKDGKTLDEFIEGMQDKGAEGKTHGAVSGVKNALSEAVHGNDDDDDGGDKRREHPRQRDREQEREREPAEASRRRRPSRESDG